MPDAVVIGAGPNGLTAANVLASAGWDVAVLEAAPEPGGAVRSGELTGEPGFVHDWFSAFYPLAVASPVMRALELESYGLRWRRMPLALAHPASDGPTVALSTDLAETCASLDRFAAGDGDAWRRLYGLWERVGDDLVDALFGRPFPPVRPALRMAAALRRDLARFVGFGAASARRVGEERFRGAGGRRLIWGNALHTDLTLDDAGGGFYGWLLACIGQQRGWPVPEGGAGSLTRALVRRLSAHGGRVECGARVVEVVVRGRRAVAVRLADGREVDAARAVVADVGAPALLLDLVGREHLPRVLVRQLERRFEYDHATVKVDWALDAPIPWASEDARRAGTVHVGEDLDGYARALRAGRAAPSEFLLVGQYSMGDPTRAPAGRETAWAYTHVPQGVWDDAIPARMEAAIEALAPGFRDSIRARHVWTPAATERADANLVGGAIGGGTARLRQQLIFRPVPALLGRPDTPVRGLYLASASAHPGGGVHGAPGANAARAALRRDCRRRTARPAASARSTAKPR